MNPEEWRAHRAEYARNYRVKNPEKQRAADRKYYAKNREKCIQCAKNYSKKRTERDPEFRAKRLQRLKIYARLIWSMHSGLKAWVFSQLGDCCSNCGFSNPLALDVHHKDGKNNGESKNTSRKSRLYYRWWKKGEIPEAEKANLELLCANCHRILHGERNKV